MRCRMSWKTNANVSPDGATAPPTQRQIPLYQTLVNTLVQYEYNLRKEAQTGDWNGSISPRVHEILMHARLKCGLTQIQRDVCDWNAVARVMLERSQDNGGSLQVHIDSAGLSHTNSPAMLWRKQGLLLIVENFKQVVDRVVKGEKPEEDADLHLFSKVRALVSFCVLPGALLSILLGLCLTSSPVKTPNFDFCTRRSGSPMN